MDLLSREPNAFIRGSPTRGVLGGIAEHTADVISLCEAGKHIHILSCTIFNMIMMISIIKF